MKPTLAKRERSKKVAVHPAAPKTNIEPAGNDKVATPHAVAASSLLDSLKERLGEAQAKLIASLEPLTGDASKSRLETRR